MLFIVQAIQPHVLLMVKKSLSVYYMFLSLCLLVTLAKCDALYLIVIEVWAKY